jgi:hypothetical protein
MNSTPVVSVGHASRPELEDHQQMKGINNDRLA